jgi:AGZA family xanthine/uracil permease-like MFS transporter
MEAFFKIRERGSNPGRETVGGLTTFLAMAYIAVVNPAILAEAGVPFQAAVTSTCLGAALMTLLMGLVANRPIALAPGMGLNAVVAYSICIGSGADWRVAMAVVLVEGLVILVLVLCGLRKAIMDAIPPDLRLAIGIGIGLFIAFIGIKGGGIVTDDASTLLALGDLSSPVCIVSIVSIVTAIALHALHVPGSLLISIIVATLAGIPLGVTVAPTEWNFGLDFSAFAAPLQEDPAAGVPALLTAVTKPALLLAAFSLLMSDFFDTMGGVVAVGKQGEFVDENNEVEDLQPILAVDSLGAVAGGFLGSSSITAYVESALGAAAGARTGLSNIVVGVLFAVVAFCAPLVGMVTGSATCGALLVVGYLMMTSIGDIDWSRFELAFPAFMTIVGIPFTYSITDGIGLGFVSYVIIMAITGRAAQVKPLMWVASAAFVAVFIIG